MILFLLTLIYMTFGLYIGALVDERQMREPVPYGEYPSVVSLRQLRFMLYGFFLFGGVPIAIYGTIEGFFERRANGFFQ